MVDRYSFHVGLFHPLPLTGFDRRFRTVPFRLQIGNLSKEEYENWRFGRVPYLEKVISGSLSQANRILRILSLHAQDRGLKPSQTVYKKWGKGRKILLRFSKTGNPLLETAYSTHYVADIKEKVKK